MTTEKDVYKDRNCMLDCMKGIACLLVVINHFHHEHLLGEIEYILSHLGVPVFFLISGYYVYKNDPEEIVKKLPKKIKHTAMLLLFHLSLYTFASMGVFLKKDCI